MEKIFADYCRMIGIEIRSRFIGFLETFENPKVGIYGFLMTGGGSKRYSEAIINK